MFFSQCCTTQATQQQYNLCYSRGIMAQLALSEAFESARKEFLRESDRAAGIDISSFTTINDVYDATDKIQKEQSKSKTLRYLQRLQPYLACIKLPRRQSRKSSRRYGHGSTKPFHILSFTVTDRLKGCIKTILQLGPMVYR